MEASPRSIASLGVNEQLLTVDEFIRLVDSVGRELALQYLKHVAEYKIAALNAAGCARVLDSPVPQLPRSDLSRSESAVSLPSVETTSSVAAMKVSVRNRNACELLDLKTKSGYCYTSILTAASYDSRVRAMGSWPNVVMLLRTAYVDTIGIDEMQFFYLKPVGGGNRLHLTLEVTPFPLLDVLCALSRDYRQRRGTLGYHIHVSREFSGMNLPPEFALSSRVGGTVQDYGDIMSWLDYVVDSASVTYVKLEFGSVGGFPLSRYVDMFSPCSQYFCGVHFSLNEGRVTVLVRMRDQYLGVFQEFIGGLLEQYSEILRNKLYEHTVYGSQAFVLGDNGVSARNLVLYKLSFPLSRFDSYDSFATVATDLNDGATFLIASSQNGSEYMVLCYMDPFKVSDVVVAQKFLNYFFVVGRVTLHEN